jgi:hypothetical protein
MSPWYRQTTGVRGERNVVESIVRSLRPMFLLLAGAVVFALGTAFVLASDATLASSSGASSDLGQAGRWLQFLAALGLLGAVCVAGWEVILRSEWIAAAEIAAVALGTLLLTIMLAALAASNGSSSGAAVTGAVGIGVWALLVLSRAARVSLSEQGAAPTPAMPAPATPAFSPGSVPAPDPASVRDPAFAPQPPTGAGLGAASAVRRRGRAELWLLAAAGLFVLAIGYGVSSAAGSTGPAVAAGLLQAAGAAALAGAVAAARSRRLLTARPVLAVIAGLGLLAVNFLAGAVVAGASFHTLTALAAAYSVVTAVELAAVIALGLAAWTRVRELYR